MARLIAVFAMLLLGGPVSSAFAAGSAAGKPAKGPKWDELLAFPAALVIAAIIAFVLYFGWRSGESAAVPKAKRKLGMPLQYLDASWTFGDSWLTNITAAAGLLTGAFSSSETIKAIVGDKPDNAIALAAGGGIVALALLAAGPIILDTTKVSKDGNTELSADANTVFGVLVATAVTLAAAYGQLWVGWRALALGGAWWLIPVGAALLLAAFAWQTTQRTLYRGSTPLPEDAAPSDAIVAAALAAAAQQTPDADPTATVARAKALITALNASDAGPSLALATAPRRAGRMRLAAMP